MELCICIFLGEEKVAKPGEKKNERVGPEGSRGRRSRVWSRGCLVQEHTTGIGSHWLQASPPTCRVAVLSQALLGSTVSSSRCTREVGRPHRRPFCQTLGLSTAMSYATFLLHSKFQGENIYSTENLWKETASNQEDCLQPSDSCPILCLQMQSKWEVIWQWCEEAVPLKLQPFPQFQAMPHLLFYFQTANWQRNPWYNLVTTQN